MIKVTVLYPNSGGAKFNMDYYVTKHMPTVRQRLGAVCKGVAVDQGVAGGTPDSPPSFIAMGHLLFDSVDAFRKAFAPHAEELMADVANYTSIEPLILISEVKM